MITYKKFIGLIIISGLIILIGLLIYFSKHNLSLSNISEDWANFAIYNGYFLSIVNVLILGYISFITYQTTYRFNKLQNQPLIYLNVDIPEMVKNEYIKDSWYVSNGAKSSAVNLLVRYWINSTNCTKWVSCTSLAEKQRLELFWIKFAYRIDICFTDITEDNFYILEFKDMHGITTEIKKEKYYFNLEEAKNNRKNNIINLLDKYEKHISSFPTEKNPMTNYINDFIMINNIM